MLPRLGFLCGGRWRSIAPTVGADVKMARNAPMNATTADHTPNGGSAEPTA
jgi:hypothetical protein